MTIEEFLGKLDGVTKTSTGWMARCKAHDDKRNSLSVREGKGGKLLIRCFRGCPADAIDAALGITWRDRTPAKEPRLREVAAYPYRDERGDLLYEKVRFEPKEFRQRCRLKDGTYQWNLRGVRRILYRLPDLMAAP